jgi:hypothetical protein
MERRGRRGCRIAGTWGTWGAQRSALRRTRPADLRLWQRRPSERFSTTRYPHLAIEIGKEGYLSVLNADHLGGYKEGAAGGDDVIARLGPVPGVWFAGIVGW